MKLHTAADLQHNKELYRSLKRYGKLIKSYCIDSVRIQIFRTYDGTLWFTRTTEYTVLEVTNLTDL